MEWLMTTSPVALSQGPCERGGQYEGIRRPGQNTEASPLWPVARAARAVGECVGGRASRVSDGVRAKMVCYSVYI